MQFILILSEKVKMFCSPNEQPRGAINFPRVKTDIDYKSTGVPHWIDLFIWLYVVYFSFFAITIVIFLVIVVAVSIIWA